MKPFCLFLVVLLLVAAPFYDVAAQEDGDLESLLEDYVDDADPGVVVYVQTPDDSLVAAVGLADLETETPLRIDDRFRIGSSTKTFVATVVLQLVDGGVVNLDDPISAYLPAEIASRVINADRATVRQVLNMTSGIFDYTESDAFDDAIYDDPAHPWTPAEVITYAYDEEPYFAPGEDFYYSNSNYILLHLLIEHMTGHSLADELEFRIFDPLAMDSCALEDPARLGEGIVHGYGYADDDDDLDDITLENDGVGMGDGGIVCTAADLGVFLPALLAGELLSDAQLAAMLAYVEDDSGDGYGLGISSRQTDYGVLIGHDGSTSGFQSDMVCLPDEDLTLVVLTNNFDSEIVTDVVDDVLWLVLEE